MNHTGTIELSTEHLTLRRFDEDDAENMFYNWANDDEVTKYLSWQSYENVEQVEDYLKNKIIVNYEKKDFYHWAIELNNIEQAVGSIDAVNIREDTDAVEIGYCIGKEFWHKGYMTEALTEVIRFFMEETGAGRVWAKHDTNNPNSGKVMEKSGMEYEGTLRRSGYNNSGICDIAVYAKVKSAAVLEAESEEEVEVTGATVTRIVAEDGTMKNVISDDTMEYVGILAKLELSPEEAAAEKKDMEEMLDYIDQLNELDTTGIEPMSHVFPVNNVFREDVVTNGDGSKDTLANAPCMKDGGFKVPKTIGD